MNEREKLIQELIEELQWVQYRQKMLDLINEKLCQMKEVAYLAKNGNLNVKELNEADSIVKRLTSQVRALDSESRRKDDHKIL